MSDRACVVGVDLGGTNVRAQTFFDDGRAAGGRVEKPSLAQLGTETIMKQIASAVHEAIEHSQGSPTKVGLAIPGHIDDAAGLVKWSPNFGIEVDGVFHYWQGVPFRQLLSDKIALPLVMANDANAAALGEYMFGTGKGHSSCFVMFTLGTGVGSGVVLGPPSVHGEITKPHLLLGGNKGGVEMGHMVLTRGGASSTAGSYGTLEAYCQKSKIMERAVFKLLRGQKSILNDLCEGDLGKVDPLMLSQAADQGDKVALDVWRETGEYLGVAVGVAINIFSPDIFAIGGQIGKAAKHFMPYVHHEAMNTAVPSLFADCTIVEAEHADDAGLLGAAALALH